MSRSRPAKPKGGRARQPAKAGPSRWSRIWPVAAFAVLLAVVAGMVILASTQTATPVITSQDDIPRISVLEAQRMADEGTALIYDTRSAAAYDAEHIAGALSLPSSDVSAHLSELPKNKTLILYCT